MKIHVPAFLWISLDRIIIQAHSIPHFKGLGMRNLKYEMRFFKKFIIMSQWQRQVTFIFANFVNFLKSMKSYLPAFLWISLDIIIVQAPSIYHFKVMRNLQYDIIFSKKSIIKPQWQGQVTLIFADSHVIFRVKLKFWLIYLSEQFIFRRGFNG